MIFLFEKRCWNGRKSEFASMLKLKRRKIENSKNKKQMILPVFKLSRVFNCFAVNPLAPGVSSL